MRKIITFITLCVLAASPLMVDGSFQDQNKKADPKDPPKTLTNGIGMKFVWIPPGNFVMGSPKEEEGRREEETQRKVTLTKGFYMSAMAVNQGQWKEVMGTNPSHFKGEKNLPVEWITWDECQEFVKKLRENDKKPYRLPTEAEWEYCCRAGTKTPFSFGETISPEQANYNGSEAYGKGKTGVNRKKPMPVGSFPPNAFGLYDMHGNVRQWCQDKFGDYPQKDVVDPQGPEAGDRYVIRGSGWNYLPIWCRSAHRHGSIAGTRSWDCGCRICFSVE